MHELVQEYLRDARGPVCVSRQSLDDGALLACFAVGPRRWRRGRQAPLWVAKLAYGARGCRRLRAEARALGQLESAAELLRLPRLLGWSEDGVETAADRACLIQSGVEGVPRPSPWPRKPRPGRLPHGFEAARDWLRYFQHMVDPVVAGIATQDLVELAAAACAHAETQARRRPELAELLAALPPVVAQAAGAVAQPPAAVVIHGDFWTGNILAHRRDGNWTKIGVIDWSGLDLGSVLDDLLTWVAQVGCGRGCPRRRERWEMLFFAPGAVRRQLRAWAETAGYGPVAARLAFYLFLLRRLQWEIGLELQTRSPQEQSAAAQEWREVLAWLAARRYPDPFTALAA